MVHDVPLVLRSVFNINAQVVRGYPGGNTLYLAVDRGEMDARMVGYASGQNRATGLAGEGVASQFCNAVRDQDPFAGIPQRADCTGAGEER